MPSPFPGMDPYLENPNGWQSFHTQFIVVLAQHLVSELGPRYSVSVETRLYIEAWSGGGGSGEFQSLGRADIGVTASGARSEGRVAVASGPITFKVMIPEAERVQEHFLEIRDGDSEDSVVTVIEVLSPSNKRPGPGRDAYIQKREYVLQSQSAFVEIDLLRTGFRMPSRPEVVGVDYCVFISTPETRPEAIVIGSRLQDQLPVFELPLAPGETGSAIDLNRVLTSTYDNGGFANRLDYSQEPNPALPPDRTAWADALLREKGLR